MARTAAEETAIMETMAAAVTQGAAEGNHYLMARAAGNLLAAYRRWEAAQA